MNGEKSLKKSVSWVSLFLLLFVSVICFATGQKWVIEVANLFDTGFTVTVVGQQNWIVPVNSSPISSGHYRTIETVNTNPEGSNKLVLKISQMQDPHNYLELTLSREAGSCHIEGHRVFPVTGKEAERHIQGGFYRTESMRTMSYPCHPSAEEAQVYVTISPKSENKALPLYSIHLKLR